MSKQLKQVLSLLLCVSLVCTPLVTFFLGAHVAAAAETSSYPAVQDAFVSNFNAQGDSVGIALNANKLIYGKFRHVYLKFDLGAIDTERYPIDGMKVMLNFRKTHAPNELVFTESESALRDSGEDWTVNNLTYNNRPQDIAESPVVTQNVTSTGEENLSVDLSAIFRSALSNGRTTVTVHLTTTRVDDSAVSASEMYASRNTLGYPGPALSVTLGQPFEEAELPVQISAPDMGNYYDNGKTAAMIFKMRNEAGKYVKVDPVSEKLSLAADDAEASTFALYVQDYFATVDHEEPEVGATKTAYAIKALDTGKYLTIQNYYTAEEFLSNTHRYFNILSGDTSGTSTDRTFEVKASADIPNWNERFYVDHYAKAGYYRIWSHLSTMRDDAGFNRFYVTMQDDAMQSSGTAALDQEYRFYFEEVPGKDLLEVSQEVSGSDAELFWLPVNGDTNPAHYSVDGSDAGIGFVDGFMRATMTDLGAGSHNYIVAYDGSGYEAKTDVKVLIFSHPGILLSEDDLASMKRHVEAKEEPWYSDYQRLLNSVSYGVASPDFVTTVFSNVGRGGAPSDSANIGYFEKGGNAAYFNALQWVITGEEQYAAKAADILTQWAQALKVIDGRDRILGAGINAYKYASAAEIIRYYDGGYSGYSDDDFKALQDMMINVVYPVIQDAAAPMLANGNWDAAALVSMMAIGVLCDKTEIFDRAMALYQDIHVNGSIFAYVNDSGQTMETGRDQAHAMLALGYMAEICLIAYNQDEDLYALYDNRLAKAFEYTAKYNLFSKELYGEDVPFDSMPNVFGDTSRGYYGAGFDRENNGLNRGELRPVFEQALALFNKAGGADLTWTAKAAAAMRPQGMVHFDNLNFGTLTHYNGEPANASGTYFQMRTRWEPLYQRNWSMVDGQRVAETLNSYYDVNENGELVTSVMKEKAPFYQLIANNDGTYSVRLVKSGAYLSVKEELVESYNVIRADATTIGESEKFLLRSTGVGPFFLVSPKYENRIVYQHAAGTGSDAVLTLRLGTKTLSQIADIPNVSTNERFIFMYNAEEIARKDSPEPPIGAMPNITTTALTGGKVGRSYSQTLAATGNGTISWSVIDGALPNGLSLTEEGLISGKPTKKGTFGFTVQASNVAGSDTQALSLVISAGASPSSPVADPVITVPEDDKDDQTDVSHEDADGTNAETPNGKAFDDVSEAHWAAGDITFVTARGLFEGTGMNLFHPEATMTRAMFARVLANLEGIEDSEYAAPVFTDVPEGRWYTAAVNWAAGSGIISGMGQGRFGPNDNLTREQLAAMVYNYATSSGYELIDVAKVTFADGDSVATWAREAANALAAAGLLTGKPDGRFDPKGNVTRAEAAAVISRLIRAHSAAQVHI
ncbi:hypothetical protein FHS18_005227 [Paenibacillus phyllosphaerae]|uniref:SLH domain-containing protein n=1 Tax=Paenibacillus phyllosphaerae TaxID=274593 RepID=A0A7W5B2S9_9BACL|nr:S-layer homology domain-containing protein [Paenibacillus phyllosphaerae]MBB3113124.1 hypothetical protein [Paenibacillus phyllosphaerae]